MIIHIHDKDMGYLVYIYEWVVCIVCVYLALSIGPWPWNVYIGMAMLSFVVLFRFL
jgi:hypothetical protein